MYIDSLNYDKELFIFGEPVLTPFGTFRYFTYKEYLLNTSLINLISQNTLHIYYDFKKQLENIQAPKEAFEELKHMKEIDLYEIILDMEQLKNAYEQAFRLLHVGNSLDTDKIMNTKEYFYFMRELIMDMNLITEEKVSPNEEIQKANERSKRVNQQDAGKQSFVDIVTSIVASTNHSFEDIGNMTIYQVYATYSRIGAIFNYQTTTLFATVAEKVDIESWNKHIDLFKTEDYAISREEFNKKFGSMLET